MERDKLSQWLVVCNARELDASRLLAAAEISGLRSRVELRETVLACWRFARVFGPRADALTAFAEGVHRACLDDRRQGTSVRCERCSLVRDTMDDAAREARDICEPYLFDEAALASRAAKS